MSGDFHDFAKELFAGLGPVAIKRMFGGAGIYADGLMFALIDEDVIYLKIDDALKAELKGEGSAPFTWSPNKGPRAGERIEMGYWRLPEIALDDPDEASAWGRKALAVARRAAAAKKPKKQSAKAAPKKRAKP